ncbi:MAG TPA: cellulase family glycosylhydrolase [Firmicutes bacterium]|nr:cellulase family glycosylhydrolase [Bacillota bacterium]
MAVKILSYAFSLTLVLTLLSLPVAAAEWIEIAPQGHYFQTESGRPFIVIGHNDAITWPNLDDLLITSNPVETDRYLAKLKANGINTLRIMLEYAQESYGLLENPLGEFAPRVVAFWDRFIKLAETYDIHLIITPWDPFWMERNWARNPYNRRNGGPMDSMKGFLTDPEAIAWQRRRLAFAIERWGGSPAILAWELMNEIELWWGATPQEISQWITETAAFVRTREMELYGRTHLLTASLATPFPSKALVDAVLNHPDLDFATTHQYVGPATNQPTNTVDAALDVELATLYARSQLTDKRPYLDTESGPIDRWINDPAFDTEYYHNMSWAHLASGGAGQGLRWPYRNPHVLTEGMYRVQAALARFVDAFDWKGFVPAPIARYATVEATPSPAQDSAPASASTLSIPDVRVFGVADKTRALLWLLNMTSRDAEQGRRTPASQPLGTATGRPALEGAFLIVDRKSWREQVWNGQFGQAKASQAYAAEAGPTATASETLTVQFWNTYTGEMIAETRVVTAADTWTIPLPAFDRDLAIVIKMVE